MPVVSELIARFRADDSQFQAGNKRVQAGLASTTALAEDLGIMFEELKAAAAVLSASLSILGAECSGVGREMTAAVTAAKALNKAFANSEAAAYAGRLQALGSVARVTDADVAQLAIVLTDLNRTLRSTTAAGYSAKLIETGTAAAAAEGRVATLTGEVAALNAEMTRLRALSSVKTPALPGPRGGGGAGSVNLRSLANEGMQVGRALNQYVTAPLLLAGGAALLVGTNFEASMAKIEGLAAVSRTQVEAWSASILHLAPVVGQMPNDLAKAMFFIASEGFRGKEALDILTASAKMSTAGMGQVADTAKAVVFAVHDYGEAVLSAARASDILTAAVRVGNVDTETLASNLGKVLPLASQMRIPFEQVAAALATMTREGATAAQAVTALRSLFSTFEHPSAATSKALKRLGLDAGQVRAAMQNDLLGTLQAIAKAAGKDQEAFAKVFPNVRAFMGVLSILGRNGDDARRSFDQVAKSAGSLNRAFGTAANTTDFRLKKALASLEASGVSLERAMAPAVKAIADDISDLADKFSKLTPEEQAAYVHMGLFVAALGPGITAISALTKGVLLARSALAALTATPWIITLSLNVAGGAALGYGLGFGLRDIQQQAHDDWNTTSRNFDSYKAGVQTRLQSAYDRFGKPGVDELAKRDHRIGQDDVAAFWGAGSDEARRNRALEKQMREGRPADNPLGPRHPAQALPHGLIGHPPADTGGETATGGAGRSSGPSAFQRAMESLSEQAYQAKRSVLFRNIEDPSQELLYDLRKEHIDGMTGATASQKRRIGAAVRQIADYQHQQYEQQQAEKKRGEAVKFKLDSLDMLGAMRENIADAVRATKSRKTEWVLQLADAGDAFMGAVADAVQATADRRSAFRSEFESALDRQNEREMPDRRSAYVSKVLRESRDLLAKGVATSAGGPWAALAPIGQLADAAGRNYDYGKNQEADKRNADQLGTYAAKLREAAAEMSGLRRATDDERVAQIMLSDGLTEQMAKSLVALQKQAEAFRKHFDETRDIAERGTNAVTGAIQQGFDTGLKGLWRTLLHNLRQGIQQLLVDEASKKLLVYFQHILNPGASQPQSTGSGGTAWGMIGAGLQAAAQWQHGRMAPGSSGGNGTGSADLVGVISGLLPSLLPGKASGGPVAANHPYWVGERRPEIFVPDRAGRILPDASALGGEVHNHTHEHVYNLTYHAPMGGDPRTEAQRAREFHRAFRESNDRYGNRT